LNALGRFTLGLQEKVKSSPRTYLPGNVKQPTAKISENMVKMLEIKTGDFVHYNEDNIEYGDDNEPQPIIKSHRVVDNSPEGLKFRLKAEDLLGTK